MFDDNNYFWYNYDTLRYRYDENGLLVSREIPGETPEYYIRDHTGRELAIHDYVEDRTKKIDIFGNELEGSATVTWFGGGGTWSNTDDKYYYVKDHLGSIRGRLIIPECSFLRATTTRLARH